MKVGRYNAFPRTHLPSYCYIRLVDHLARKITYVSRCVLFSAWAEPDPAVRNVMWEPLLTYLTSKLSPIANGRGTTANSLLAAL
jgi:hypothetical protein